MRTIRYFLIFIFISFSLFSATSSISGSLALGDVNLGGIKLNFIDSSNQVFSVETNIYGQFKTELPSKKYRIEIGNYGYILEKNNDKIYDFSNSSKQYHLALNVHERLSSFSGKVVNEELEPILNSKITLQSSNFTKIVYTDQFGNFKSEVPPGIFTITSEYEGVSPETVIKQIPKASSVTNIFFTLKHKKYSISGVITDGIHPLSNILARVYSEKGDLLSTALSSENGHYEFQGLNGNINSYILIDIANYEKYQSENIKLSDNIKNNIIILKSN